MKIKREIEESLIVAWTDPSGVEHERDATPDDLARGGYVRDGDTRAGLREALRARERAELDALAELDEQRARAEKAEGLLIQRETELRLAREDGDERARDLRQAYERAVAAAEKAERELATERYEHGYTLTSRDMIHNKLAQAERERDEAKAGHNAVQADLAETVHERDTLRAELARLTAPGEGEPTDEELRAVHGRACGGATADGDTRALCIARRALWRGGVAHERAKGHSVGCKCGRRSPATKDEDATIDAAQDAGWQVDGVNDCTEDMCPKCQRARLTAPGEGTNEATEAQYREQSDFDAGVAHERARQAKDPRMKGRTLEVMLDECEDLEALEQDAYVAPKSREGLSLARQIAKLYAAARHAEARQQPEKDRATDEELVGVMRAAVMDVPCLPPAQWEVWLDARDKAGVRAVAARVRQERCLVAQAVGMGADLYATAHGVAYRVTVAKGRHMQRAYPDAADVPATLARLLGEVSRG